MKVMGDMEGVKELLRLIQLLLPGKNTSGSTIKGSCGADDANEPTLVIRQLLINCAGFKLMLLLLLSNDCKKVLSVLLPRFSAVVVVFKVAPFFKFADFEVEEEVGHLATAADHAAEVLLPRAEVLLKE